MACNGSALIVQIGAGGGDHRLQRVFAHGIEARFAEMSIDPHSQDGGIGAREVAHAMNAQHLDKPDHGRADIIEIKQRLALPLGERLDR